MAAAASSQQEWRCPAEPAKNDPPLNPATSLNPLSNFQKRKKKDPRHHHHHHHRVPQTGQWRIVVMVVVKTGKSQLTRAIGDPQPGVKILEEFGVFAPSGVSIRNGAIVCPQQPDTALILTGRRRRGRRRGRERHWRRRGQQ